MATRKTINSALTPTKYLNRNLSQAAREAFDAVCAGSHPVYNLSWTDFYAVFRNSRQLAREASELGPSTDPEIRAVIHMMREYHARLRGVLFLVAIETLFNLGRQNTCEVLWIYGDQLELVDQISERLAETEEEIAQVQAHFDEAVCA